MIRIFTSSCDRLHATSITVHFSKNCAHANIMEFCVQNKNYKNCKKGLKWEELKLMQDLLTKIFLHQVIKKCYMANDLQFLSLVEMLVQLCYSKPHDSVSVCVTPTAQTNKVGSTIVYYKQIMES
jgi:hypothetical protein